MASKMQLPYSSTKQSKKPSNTNFIDSKRNFAHNVSMLKAFRQKLGLTQAQLAEDIGVSRRSIQYYESGTEPKHRLGKQAIEAWIAEANFMAEQNLQAGRK